MQNLDQLPGLSSLHEVLRGVAFPDRDKWKKAAGQQERQLHSLTISVSYNVQWLSSIWACKPFTHTERNYRSDKKLLVEGKLSQMSCFSCFHKEELLQMLQLWQVVGLNTAFMFIMISRVLPSIFFIQYKSRWVFFSLWYSPLDFPGCSPDILATATSILWACIPNQGVSWRKQI